jgi:hypothetical protein
MREQLKKKKEEMTRKIGRDGPRNRLAFQAAVARWIICFLLNQRY